jgi:hypothetical protein
VGKGPRIPESDFIFLFILVFIILGHHQGRSNRDE